MRYLITLIGGIEMKYEVGVEKRFWKYYTVEADSEKAAKHLAMSLAIRETPSTAGDDFLDYGNDPIVIAIELKE